MNENLNLETRLEELAAKLQKAETFAEAAAWGNRAREEIERIQGLMRALDLKIAREAHELELLKLENAKKSLVGRLFGGASPEEKELAEKIENYRQAKVELTRAIQQLQEYMDFTPTSAEQQRKLLQELRLRRRQIQEQKREITTVLGTARPGAPKPADETFDPASVSRRKARYARDSQVLPRETMEEATQRQLEQNARDIQWAERFHE